MLTEKQLVDLVAAYGARIRRQDADTIDVSITIAHGDYVGLAISKTERSICGYSFYLQGKMLKDCLRAVASMLNLITLATIIWDACEVPS